MTNKRTPYWNKMMNGSIVLLPNGKRLSAVSMNIPARSEIQLMMTLKNEYTPSNKMNDEDSQRPTRMPAMAKKSEAKTETRKTKRSSFGSFGIKMSPYNEN